MALLVAVVAGVAVVQPRHASAYTIETQISQGCHEAITSAALRAARTQSPSAKPLGSLGEDPYLIDDLPFAMAGDMRDIGAASLVIGVRDNDLKGRNPQSLDQLVEVHGDPNAQDEHCLRSPSQDEPNGTTLGLADCRAFIRGRMVAAIDGGLDAAGVPDTHLRANVAVYLTFAGKQNAPLPVFYFEVGRALHALQDSFSHTWRTADGTHVTVVLNWVEYSENTLVESRDGPEHRTELDRCDDPDPLRTERHRLAGEASTALLLVGLDTTLDREAKLDAVDAVLAHYVDYQPGCTFDNRWCDAPERAYENSNACGCNVASGGATGAIGIVSIALAFLLRNRALKATT